MSRAEGVTQILPLLPVSSLLIPQCGFGVQNWAPPTCLKQKRQQLKRGLEPQELRGSETPDPTHCPCSHSVEEARGPDLFLRHCPVHSHLGHLCLLCHCPPQPGQALHVWKTGPSPWVSFSCFPHEPRPSVAPTLKFHAAERGQRPCPGKRDACSWWWEQLSGTHIGGP